jgi:hypothetical protein
MTSADVSRAQYAVLWDVDAANTYATIALGAGVAREGSWMNTC